MLLAQCETPINCDADDFRAKLLTVPCPLRKSQHAQHFTRARSVKPVTSCHSDVASVPSLPSRSVGTAIDARNVAAGAGSSSSSMQFCARAASEDAHVPLERLVDDECMATSVATVAVGLPSPAPPKFRSALLRLLSAEMEAFLQSEQSARKAVRRQLLADGCRGKYVIDGTELWYEKECDRRSKQDVTTGNSTMTSTAFVERLTDAIEQCIGSQGEVHELLLYVVMLLLTQIGFALVHIACAGPQFALCGGERKITYELARGGGGQWHLRGQYCAYGFSQYHVSETGGTTTLQDDRPLSCASASSVHRGFVIALELSVKNRTGFSIDVQDVFDDVCIFSPDGLPVPLEPVSTNWHDTDTQEEEDVACNLLPPQPTSPAPTPSVGTNAKAFRQWLWPAEETVHGQPISGALVPGEMSDMWRSWSCVNPSTRCKDNPEAELLLEWLL